MSCKSNFCLRRVWFWSFHWICWQYKKQTNKQTKKNIINLEHLKHVILNCMFLEQEPHFAITEWEFRMKLSKCDFRMRDNHLALSWYLTEHIIINKCFNHNIPDGKWRRETAKQVLNVLDKILRVLNEVKFTHLMILPATLSKKISG